MSIASRKHDVTAIQVYDRRDASVPDVGLNIFHPLFHSTLFKKPHKSFHIIFISGHTGQIHIIRELLDFRPINAGTDVGAALKYLTDALKKRCTTFVIFT